MESKVVFVESALDKVGLINNLYDSVDQWCGVSYTPSTPLVTGKVQWIVEDGVTQAVLVVSRYRKTVNSTTVLQRWIFVGQIQALNGDPSSLLEVSDDT